MHINIVCNIGDTIYIYDPEDVFEREKTIEYVLLCGTKNEDIYMKADAYDDIICSYDNLINTTPDEGGLYYFRCKESRDLFKESLKEDY